MDRSTGRTASTHKSPGFTYCTTFSLWDTFRGENPLLYVIQPRHMEDAVQTMLEHYKLMTPHCLPVWVNAGKENWCMIAYHSISTIADAYRKGLRGFDADFALKAMNDTMNHGHDGRDRELAEYRTQGYVARNSPGRGGDRARLQKQCVSRTLEYCYNDACIARFADAIGKPELGAESRKRAENYRNVYDPAVGFMRGRLASGKWAEPFDPLEGQFRRLHRGRRLALSLLRPARRAGSDRVAGRRADVCRPPGRDVQQSHRQSVGDPRPHRADRPVLPRQRAVPPHGLSLRLRRSALEDAAAGAAGDGALYDNTRDGLPGNDDCGQISAWYVWSAMGLYPVDPASGEYVIGSPVLDKATIHLDPKYAIGKTFTVIARHNSPMNIYIQSATLNGELLERNFITHEELAAGGELVLEMGPQPKFTRTVSGK